MPTQSHNATKEVKEREGNIVTGQGGNRDTTRLLVTSQGKQTKQCAGKPLPRADLKPLEKNNILKRIRPQTPPLHPLREDEHLKSKHLQLLEPRHLFHRRRTHPLLVVARVVGRDHLAVEYGRPRVMEKKEGATTFSIPSLLAYRNRQPDRVLPALAAYTSYYTVSGPTGRGQRVMLSHPSEPFLSGPRCRRCMS